MGVRGAADRCVVRRLCIVIGGSENSYPVLGISILTVWPAGTVA